ncbi:DUF427 domain-containing protein [Streptomyces sp. NPDC000888]
MAYFPPGDITAGVLEPGEHIYYDIAGAHRVAWSYEDASTEVRRVSGLVSFEPDEIEVQLDGVRLRLEPGQNVVSHGVDRNLTLDETTAVGQP